MTGALAGAAVAAAAALAAWNAGVASAEPLDPTRAHRIVAGPPRGSAPMARIDAARTGRSVDALPTTPRVLWRTRVASGVAHGIAVDRAGAVVVAGAVAQIVELDASGHIAWSASTGVHAPATAPVLASDGSRFILTDDGAAVAFTPEGRERSSVHALPSGSDAVDPLPTPDGGVAFGAARALAWLEPSGRIIRAAELPSEVGALAEARGVMTVVTRAGGVFEWRPPAEPVHKGELGGRVRFGASVARGAVVANLGSLGIAMLDLGSGRQTIRAEISGMAFVDPIVIAIDGGTRTVTSDGTLVGHDAAGAEMLRVPLEPVSSVGDAGAATVGSSSGAPLIVDGRGTVGFARAGLDAGVVTSGGEVRVAEGSACDEPVAIAPAGKRRMVVACADGLVLMLGQ